MHVVNLRWWPNVAHLVLAVGSVVTAPMANAQARAGIPVPQANATSEATGSASTEAYARLRAQFGVPVGIDDEMANDDEAIQRAGFGNAVKFSGKVNKGVSTFNKTVKYGQAGLSIWAAIEGMRQLASEGMKGCDYIKGFQVAEQLGTSVEDLNGIFGKAEKKLTAWASGDYIKRVFGDRAASARAKLADKEYREMIANAEQTCQAMTNVNEFKVFNAIVYNGEKGFGPFLAALLTDSLKGKRPVVGNTIAIRPMLLDSLLGVAARLPKITNDTIHQAMFKAYREDMDYATKLLNNLAALHDQLNELKEANILKASARTNVAGGDTTADGRPRTWECPKGYPDPNGLGHPTSSSTRFAGVPICGEIMAEQAPQVLAASEVFLMQLMAISQQVGAVSLQSDATRLGGRAHWERIRQDVVRPRLTAR